MPESLHRELTDLVYEMGKGLPPRERPTIDATIQKAVETLLAAGKIGQPTDVMVPAEGACPRCGGIPEELMPLAKATIQYYLAEPIFARILNGIISDYRAEKR